MARIAGWVVPLSLAQAAIVAAGVWLALRALPPDRARLRHGIVIAALAVVTGSLVATASILLADWHTHVSCWSQAAEAPAAVSAACHSHGVPGVGAAESGSAEKTSAVVAWWSGIRVPSVPGARAIAGAWTDVSGMVGALWLATVLLLGVRELRIRRAVRIARREATPVADGRVAAMLHDLLGDLGIRSAVEIRESGAVGTPCVIGGGPPMILFPRRLLPALDAGELRGVIAHELAHVRRGDVTTISLQRTAEALLCFNPFARWISRRAREEQEVACDRLGAEVGTGSRTGYARALLLLEGFRSAPIGSGSVPALLGEGELVKRVERLLAPAWPGRPLRAVATTLALAGCLLAGALAQATLTGASLGSWAIMVEDNQHRSVGPD